MSVTREQVETAVHRIVDLIMNDEIIQPVVHALAAKSQPELAGLSEFTEQQEELWYASETEAVYWLIGHAMTKIRHFETDTN